MEITEIYHVYGCNDDGRDLLDSEFIDFKCACKYAVAKYGRIHYNLPKVVKCTYSYDPKHNTVSESREVIKPEQIYYMNKI